MTPISFTSALLILAAASSAPALPECGLAGGPAVPDIATADAIAKAVIAERQSQEESSKYELKVVADRDRPGSWIVMQSLPDPPSPKDGTVWVTAGGGMTVRIDRCTGTVSDLHYLR